MMNGGPLGMPQSPDRRPASRPETTHRPPEPQPIREEPRTVHQTAAGHHIVKEERSFKPYIVLVIAVLIILVVIVVGWLLWPKSQGAGASAIDSSKYQAVFFTNGQVYFGKLQVLSGETMKLTDVYYLQTQANGQSSSKNPQETSSDQNNVQLIKLGGEIHGPEDAMIILKDQVLFYENLKSDGKVAQSIQKYKNPN